MTGLDVRGDLHSYLQGARRTLVWKLDGLGEYDIRRPLTPTGTNLLGLVKHSARTELLYFGMVFGRRHGRSLPWLTDDAEVNVDMWATAEETRDQIVDLYCGVWEVADATITELPLETVGRVPWWGDDGAVTLHHILVHVTAETQRHAGHADLVREIIDGSAGLLEGHSNLPSSDPDWWEAYRARVEAAARLAAGT